MTDGAHFEILCSKEKTHPKEYSPYVKSKVTDKRKLQGITVQSDKTGKLYTLNQYKLLHKEITKKYKIIIKDVQNAIMFKKNE